MSLRRAPSQNQPACLSSSPKSVASRLRVAPHSSTSSKSAFGSSATPPPTTPMMTASCEPRRGCFRRKLKMYFEHECPHTPQVIIVPKGGYVPSSFPRAHRKSRAFRRTKHPAPGGRHPSCVHHAFAGFSAKPRSVPSPALVSAARRHPSRRTGRMEGAGVLGPAVMMLQRTLPVGSEDRETDHQVLRIDPTKLTAITSRLQRCRFWSSCPECR